MLLLSVDFKTLRENWLQVYHKIQDIESILLRFSGICKACSTKGLSFMEDTPGEDDLLGPVSSLWTGRPWVFSLDAVPAVFCLGSSVGLCL